MCAGPARVELTRDATAKTHAAIERLVREGLTPSLIVTLHRNNATADKLPRMRDWFRYLDTLGITSARLHDLEIESAAIGAKYGLTPDEQMAAFLDFAALEPELRRLRFDVFSDIRKMLLGAGSVARRASGTPAIRTPRAPSRASRGTDSAATAAGRTRTASTSSRPTAKGSSVISRSTTRRRRPAAATTAGSS